ncbi:uncharacterized protein LOC135692754 [Rhopilema esculentum]|uniref:uncharacterized protein LOC135692754 n=1 Tax=Rhopilema esculentum TaxID=499914 RepID=UPI0031E46E7D
MDSHKGIFLVLLATIMANSDAFPVGHPNNTTNHQANATQTVESIRQSFHSMTINEIAKSMRDSIFNLIKDCLIVEQNFASSLPQNLETASAPFNQLKLDSISCQPFQIVDRMRTYRHALIQFTNPLNTMMKEAQWSPTQRRMLLKLSNSLIWLNVYQIKMLESFEADEVKSSLSPSVLQLETATRSYLANNFPQLHVTENQMKTVRTLSFVKALSKVVETMQLETGLAMPFTE